MAEESQTCNHSQLNEARLNFVRNLYNRISSSLANVQLESEKETSSIPEQSLEKLEGIGLFVYIRENLGEIKSKFPQFTDNQTFNALLEQWQKMGESQKLTYCSKINSKVLEKSKKLKKVTKMAQKLVESLATTGALGDLEEDIEQPLNTDEKQKDDDEFQEEDHIPKKKNPNAESNVSGDMINPPVELTDQQKGQENMKTNELEENQNAPSAHVACQSLENNVSSNYLHNIDRLQNPENSQKPLDSAQAQDQEKNVPLLSNEIVDNQQVGKEEQKDMIQKSKPNVSDNNDDQTNEIVDDNLADGVKTPCEKEVEL